MESAPTSPPRRAVARATLRQIAALLLASAGGCATTSSRLPSRFAVDLESVAAFGEENTITSAGGRMRESEERFELRRQDDCRLLAFGAQAHLTRALDAGTVHVSGAAQDLVLERLPTGAYPLVRRKGLLWAGGERLVVEWPGGRTPRSEATVEAARFELTAPSQLKTNDASPYVVSLLTPFTVHWVSVPNETVGLSLFAPNSSHILCEFDGALGVGSIPQPLLAELAVGEGTIKLYIEHKQVKSSGNQDMEVSVTSYAYARELRLSLDR